MLKVKSLHKKYEGLEGANALRGVSLQLKAGQHLFVIGETGSGKSTLLKSIYGIETPDSGSVIFNKEIKQHFGQLIPGFEHMNYVSQQVLIKAFNTVENRISAHLPNGLTQQQAKKKIGELLNLLELKDYRSKQVRELSGGQQQRVSLACAFAKFPKLLLLDEPFAHLDPQLKNKLFQYLQKELSKGELSIITVTHDHQETLKYASKILVLKNGQVVQSGDAFEVYSNPKNTYVAGLLGEYNSLVWENRNWYFRPEELLISENGIPVKLLNQSFVGHYWQLEVGLQNQTLVAYSKHKISEQTTELKIDFPKHKEIKANGKIVLV